MTAAIIVAAACLGLTVGYLLGCERVHQVRRQRNIAYRNLDSAHAELAALRSKEILRDAAIDKALDRLLRKEAS